MLKLSQLLRQPLVGLHKVRHLGGHRADLPILTPHQRDQLVARQLLRGRHSVITAHPSRSASIDTPKSHKYQQSHRATPARLTTRSAQGLNVYSTGRRAQLTPIADSDAELIDLVRVLAARASS